jgi:hypothetical protein
MAFDLQGTNHGLLLAGGHPAEHAPLSQDTTKGIEIFWKGSCVDGLVRPRDVDLRRDGSHGEVTVPGHDPEGYALLGEIGDRVECVGAHPLGEDDQGGGPRCVGKRLPGQRR